MKGKLSVLLALTFLWPAAAGAQVAYSGVPGKWKCGGNGVVYSGVPCKWKKGSQKNKAANESDKRQEEPKGGKSGESSGK